MKKKILWILFVAFAIIIGLYPFLYFLIDRKFGLLASKDAELFMNVAWNIGFYTHIVLGGFALMIGWIQFSTKFRQNKPELHKNIGKAYIILVLLSAIAGIYIGFFATGGLVTSLGFISLGIIWFYTTLMAYINIKNKQVNKHQQMMIYSYAACFSAVTLRIWLPTLMAIFGNFITAYTIVAWLCWIPNIIVAYFINAKLRMSVLR
jgi:uncharacterized membrane protein